MVDEASYIVDEEAGWRMRCRTFDYWDSRWMKCRTFDYWDSR